MKRNRLIWCVLFGGTFVGAMMHVAVSVAKDGAPPPRAAASPEEMAEKTAVVLVRLARCCPASSWPDAEKRIQKEIALSNLTVLTVEEKPGRTASLQTALASALKESAARGAILIAVSPDAGIQLHTLFYNRDTNAPEYRRHFLGRAPTLDAVEIAAIKTREAVLAALYERVSVSDTDNDAPQKRADGSTPETSPSRIAARAETAADKRIRLCGIYGAAWSPGGVGVLGVAGGGLRVRLFRGFALGADGWISVPRREIKAAIGEATVQLIAGRLTAAFGFKRLGPVLPAAGVRLGVVNLRSDGKSNTHPFTAVSKLLFYGSGFLEAGFVIAEQVVLPVSLDLGALPPGVDILFAKSTEASMKVFMLEAKIGIAVLL